MSEQQKFFASVSGAVVVHLIFFLFVFGLLSTRSAKSASRGQERNSEAESSPQELVVLMSDLMDHLTIEPAPPLARSFVATDLNPRESDPPVKATYESDRHTRAASALRPNLSLPQEDGPTLAGESALSQLTLASRDFREGEKSATGARSADRSAGKEKSEGKETEAARADQMKRSDTMPKSSGLSDPGEATLAEAEKALLPNTQKSFYDPRSDFPASDWSAMSTEEDRLAGAGLKGAEEEETAEPTEQVKRRDAAGESVSEPGGATSTEELVAESFSPEERQSERNGSTATIGQDAVDAVETALGRYQMAVREVIAATWHRYRQDNAEVVTWGILKLKFSVDQDGQVNNLQITKNEANAILAEFSLKAIRDAKLPAMPAEVAKSVGSQGLVIQYDIIIY